MLRNPGHFMPQPGPDSMLDIANPHFRGARQPPTAHRGTAGAGAAAGPAAFSPPPRSGGARRVA